MLRTFAFILLVGILALAGYVAMQPPVSTISRSATVAAAPAAIFPFINDLHKWQEWSPWAKVDPDAKITFEGPQSGIGAAFSWAGNHDVGEGKMTIAESNPDSHVKMKLDFLKPFASQSVADFDLKPEGSGTKVTWAMTGERPFLARVMCTIFNADKMVGDMFEKGLANLDKLATASPATTVPAKP